MQRFLQIHRPEPNFSCITWRNHQKALVSTRTQIKQSRAVHIPYRLKMMSASAERRYGRQLTSDLPDKIKQDFLHALAISIRLFGCTTWMLTKRIEKRLDKVDTRMLCAKLNKSWEQCATKQKLYGHLHPISQTI